MDPPPTRLGVPEAVVDDGLRARELARTLTTPSGQQSWVVNGRWDVSVEYVNGYFLLCDRHCA